MTLTPDLSNKQLDKQTLERPNAQAGMEPPFPFGKILSVLVGAVAIVVMAIASFHYLDRADPYIQQVLALEGDASRGTEIFLMNCATCHGLQGKGEVGPSLQHVSSRKSEVGLIRQVVSGKTPPMPQFQPTPQDMADLLAFLERL